MLARGSAGAILTRQVRGRIAIRILGCIGFSPMHGLALDLRPELRPRTPSRRRARIAVHLVGGVASPPTSIVSVQSTAWMCVQTSMARRGCRQSRTHPKLR